MSIKIVKQFITKIKEAQELQAGIAKAIKTENTTEAITELAAKYGYNFTPEELGNLEEGELNEEKLEAITGGFFYYAAPTMAKQNEESRKSMMQLLRTLDNTLI